MAEVHITPLAKRLAEENNVDWRRLAGSGAGGQITESDVIDYLSKVMAGEEDVDPTPEPLPEGLSAWPGEESPGIGRSTGGTVSAAPVHVDPDRGRGEPSPFEPEIDEDIFLFEEDEPQAAGVVEDSGQLDSDPWGEPASEHGDWSLADDDESLESQQPGREPVAGASGWMFDGPSEPDEVFAGSAREVGGELDEATFELDLGWGGDEVEAAEVERVPGGEEEAAEAEWAPGGEQQAMFGEEPAGVEFEEKNEPVSAFTPVLSDDGPEAGGGAGGARSVDAEEESVGVAGRAPVLTEEAPSAAASPGAYLGAVISVLRRRIEVGDLLSAVDAVADELGATPEAVRGALLLRAAGRAASESGSALGDSRPALLHFEGTGLAIRRLGYGRGFADLVREFGEAPSDGETVADGLKVADLTELGLDDAVLPVQGPVLILGRPRSRSREGATAFLSLVGDVPAVTGARYLARVEELLAAPVKLVV